MDTVVRAVAIYLFLLLLFRLAGTRTLTSITAFDFILLLIISEAAQNAMVGNDYSIVNAVVLIGTLVLTDIAFSLVKQWFPRVERLLDGLPLVIVEHGRPLRDRMAKARVDEDDVMAAARELQGLEHLGQIKYAVLERGGSISIVPEERRRSSEERAA
jgi:uncharacterized membrane protein YcaP (DUF421 family)